MSKTTTLPLMEAPQAFSPTAPIPHGLSLIEASAGTGKTWTLAALATRLVAEEGIGLDKLLIVTFSRAASQELRSRVRSRLDSTLTALRRAPHPDDDPIVKHLRSDDPAVLQLRQQRLADALAGFDAATVATIHQFCHIVLKGLGVAGDSDPFAQLVEDTSTLRDEVIDDVYLRARQHASFTVSYAEAKRVANEALNQNTAELAPQPPPERTADLMRFCTDVRAEYAKRKRRAGVLEYDDLLLQLRNALRDESSMARERMRARWSAVLVDEFQDTDPVQWEVFERAFADGGRALVLVGDPKQAIYGFRGGDVYTYLMAAAQARAAGNVFTLPVNHRSDEPLVTALGQLLGDVELSPEIRAHHIEAGRKIAAIQGLGPSPIELRWHRNTGDSLPAVGEARELLYRDVAVRTSSILSSGATVTQPPREPRPVEPTDIAILCHRHQDLVEIRRALREVGIPAVMMSSDSVLRSEAGHWWLHLLMALEQPHRSERVRAACLTPLLGWDVDRLEAATSSGADEAIEYIHRLLGLFDAGGVAAVLDALIADGLLRRLLSRLGGERDITDIEHCCQLLARYHLETNAGISALVSWLVDQSAADARVTADSRIMRLDSDAHAVTLATIHASKGLQYPIVLAPTLWSRWSPKPSVPQIVNANGHRELNFDEQTIRSPQAAEEAIGEGLRLAYVAMTRAQSHLVLWWMPTKTNTTTSPLHRLLFGQAPNPAGIAELTQARRNQVPTPVTTRALSGCPDAAAAQAVLEAWARGGAFNLTEIDPHEQPRRLSVPVEDTELSVATFDIANLDRRWRRTSYSALTAAAEAIVAASASAGDAVGSADHAAAGVIASEPDFGAEMVDIDPDLVLPGVSSPDGQRPADAPPAALSPMADMPAGATFGSLVHAVLELADFQADDLSSELERVAQDEITHWPVDVDLTKLAGALDLVCRTGFGPIAGDVTLRDIAASDRLAEMDFELPLAGGERANASARLADFAPLLREHLAPGDPLVAYADELSNTPLGDQPLRGYLTGSIDLTFRHDGRYYVVDYKTNRLGDIDLPLTLDAYHPGRLAEAMMHSSYPLQAILYSVVLHRYLRWRLPGYEPGKHLGGVAYLYVRGMAGPDTPRADGQPYGVFSWTPPAQLVVELSAALDGRRPGDTKGVA